MKTKKYLFLAAAAMAFAACSNDDNAVNNAPVAARITAGIDGVQTRAYDEKWENGDEIGITCKSRNQGKTQYANMRYSTPTGNGTFTHVDGDATGIFFQDTETVDFSAYYPFMQTEGTSAGTVTSVTTNDQTGQKKFDFLFAEGATASSNSTTVKFTGNAIFKHKMTRLILEINTDANSGFTTTDVASGTYALKGLKHSGSFNTTDGTATATGDAPDEFWTITATPSDVNNVRTYTLILYPQPDGDDLRFRATINGENYECDITPDLETGMSYTHTITVKKNGLEVTSSTIQAWGTGTDSNDFATMQ